MHIKENGFGMKNIITLLFIVIVMISYNICNSQTIAEPYKVGSWLGFRSAAISHTFDDNHRNQLEIAVPMFNKFDYKLTLFTLTGTGTGYLEPNWSGLQEAASQGHEIASHTVSHPYLDQITLEQQNAR